MAYQDLIDLINTHAKRLGYNESKEMARMVKELEDASRNLWAVAGNLKGISASDSHAVQQAAKTLGFLD